MASNGLTVSQVSDCLGIADTDLQAITDELTVDVEQILGSQTLLGDRPG